MVISTIRRDREDPEHSIREPNNCRAREELGDDDSVAHEELPRMRDHEGHMRCETMQMQACTLLFVGTRSTSRVGGRLLTNALQADTK